MTMNADLLVNREAILCDGKRGRVIAAYLSYGRLILVIEHPDNGQLSEHNATDVRLFWPGREA